MTQVKVGDRIQSFDVICPIDTTRGSYLGVVTELRKDPFDGVEYVHYRAEYYMRDGKVITHVDREMRAPQNGTPTSLGNVTDGIFVIPPAVS